MIVITAFVANMRDAEGAAVFTKPFDTGALLRTIEQLHGGRSAA